MFPNSYICPFFNRAAVDTFVRDYALHPSTPLPLVTLVNKCYSATIGSFDYNVCLFGTIRQTEKSGSRRSHSLGSFSHWDEPSLWSDSEGKLATLTGYEGKAASPFASAIQKAMVYDKGEMCAGGIRRDVSIGRVWTRNCIFFQNETARSFSMISSVTDGIAGKGLSSLRRHIRDRRCRGAQYLPLRYLFGNAGSMSSSISLERNNLIQLQLTQINLVVLWDNIAYITTKTWT